jgi:ATP-dependent RNA helicase SUPV3L1/SUV3
LDADGGLIGDARPNEASYLVGSERAETIAMGEMLALLGPTNTGKTHRALEQLPAHERAAIGLPLRLLAREVYDRLTATLGRDAVALVTGEERRVPRRPRIWVCTVEAMPTELDVDFAVIDEIQLAAHEERGHVFTDRLLHLRGRNATWFLGADTMAPMLNALIPDIRVERRPRLSQLSYGGTLSMAQLPPRTAVVAFSAKQVYAIAERLRVKRGGTAIVTGALSPRARNAQVALFQSGEVDYLVATDAIGMGLNLDLDCVAFSDIQKFDGRRNRPLHDAELAQIAGRAGRYRQDGMFAMLSPEPDLLPRSIRAIETHRFPAITQVYYRNPLLQFESTEALLRSLRQPPPKDCFRLPEDSDDYHALLSLMRHPDVSARARGNERVRLLWEICQIPDFRQLALDDHHRLQAELFLRLTRGTGCLEADFVRRRLQSLSSTAGDIETLLARMQAVRVWTYITQRSHWVESAEEFQEEARALEDRLSDSLHAALVGRFVTERRRTVAGPQSIANGKTSNDRSLAGQLKTVIARESQGLAAVLPSAQATLENAAERWSEAAHGCFELQTNGKMTEVGSQTVIARLVPGQSVTQPEVVVLVAVSPGVRLRLHRRLVAWTRDAVALLHSPWSRSETEQRSPELSGLLYQLQIGLGTVRVRDLSVSPGMLSRDEREQLKRLGIVVGHAVVYALANLKRDRLVLRAGLCSGYLGVGIEGPDQTLGEPSWQLSSRIPIPVYAAMGYPVFGPRAVFAPVAEALIASRRPRPSALAKQLGCDKQEAMVAYDALYDSSIPHEK